MTERIKVGITMGDFNGIGPEVTLKAVSDKLIAKAALPVIYGSSKVVSYHKNIVTGLDFQFQSLRTANKLSKEKPNVINCWEEPVNINLGKATEESGKFASLVLDRAVSDLKEGLIDVLVTAPINKHAMNLAGFTFAGHTEFLAKFLEGSPLMILSEDSLRLAVVTGHVPLSDVSQLITKQSVGSALEIFNSSLRNDFGIEKPTIAVLGLNPHAGEEGGIGKEEKIHIRPAIIEAKKQGMLAFGPFPADGFFGSGQFRKFDGVLAMYHDQGLVPFKTLAFENGVNFTAGLNHIRTSPDHGTAYELAGKNAASPSSMIASIRLSCDIFKNRKTLVKPKEVAPQN